MSGTNLVTTDAGDLYDETLLALEEAVGEPLYPGDERRIFAEAMIPVLLAAYSSVEDASRQTMLRYARGEVLDALGERLAVKRLEGSKAETVVEFALSEVRTRTVAIPKGTKVTADGEVYFATDTDAAIPAGGISITVACTATEAGSAANGYAEGSIRTLVDKIAYIASVSNVTASAGGSDGEPYDDEGDDRYRERIRLAPERLSTAGPELGYSYWARTADSDIADVAVVSGSELHVSDVPVRGGVAYLGGDALEPDRGLSVNGFEEGFSYTFEDSLLAIDLEGQLADESSVEVRVWRRLDGRVKIIPLMEGGRIPDAAVLEKVAEAVNSKDVRPMTDLVTVEAPRTVDYDIELTYWTTPENEAVVVEAVEGAGGAIDRYIEKQCSVMGRDINPDVLTSYIIDPDWDELLKGAIRVEIASPSYTPVDATEVARFTGNLKVSHVLETQARWD